MSTIDIVHGVVGRRSNINRQEMVDILLALPMEIVAASTIGGRTDDGRLCVAGEVLYDPRNEACATAKVWANMCSGITCISVLQRAIHRSPHGPQVNGFVVRDDQPSEIHPHQHAELIFVPAALQGRESEAKLRRHADHVLVVE